MYFHEYDFLNVKYGPILEINFPNQRQNWLYLLLKTRRYLMSVKPKTGKDCGLLVEQLEFNFK
jgi:hypothetical protein